VAPPEADLTTKTSASGGKARNSIPFSFFSSFRAFVMFFSGGSGLGVLQVQKEKLHYPYLQRGARQMGVAALLEQAIKEAGEAES